MGLLGGQASLDKQDKNLARAGAYDDLNKIKAIKKRMWTLSILFVVLAIFTIYPIHILVFGDVPMGQRLDLVKEYGVSLFYAIKPGTRYSFLQWLNDHHGWYARAALAGLHGDPAGIPVWRSAILILGLTALAMFPWSMIGKLTEGLEATPNIYGNTRWADERDIEAMSKRDLIGFDGKLFLVGKLKDKLIQMKETLSVLLLAPPGTGKTVAFIVPSTVMMDKSCQLLNDQKPELFHMTSGHRATIGPVFQLMWSAQDMPNGGYVTEEQAMLMSPDLFDMHDGQMVRDENGAIKVKPIFYPSWNPLGPASIPSPGPRRDLYVERLASVLCPDPQGGGDKFWTSKARAALVGLIHYLVAKVEFADSPDFPDIDHTGIPERWIGKEPSLPMLVDWFTEAQNVANEGEGDDPLRELFRIAIADAKKMEAANLTRNGVSIMNRAVVELTALMNSPDKTRGSILSTVDEAMNPFKNEAVRQRTSTSSFSFNELRGSPKPEARTREEEKAARARSEGRHYMPRYARDEWNPITIYISINAEDAKAFATITGIFVDSANAYLVANGPNAIDDRGNQLGPHDFFFLLDETPTLPKLDTVINGPAVGRSKRVSYAIVGQDFAQIETRYSKAEVETLKSTTAIKVILSQNNETAAKTISQMAGAMTFKKANYQTKKGEDPVTQLLAIRKEVANTENWEKRDFIDASFVMSMPLGKHIVLVQNFMNRPILANTPRFFEEPDIARRVYNLRTGSGPKPALPMPARMMKTSAVVAAEAVERARSQASIRDAVDEPEVALLVTPRNIHELSRDPATNTLQNEIGSTFAAARVHLTDKDEYFDLPDQDAIVSGSEAGALHEIVADRKVYVFSQDDFAAMNALFREAGLPEIPDQLMMEMRPAALAIDDEADGDFFSIGYYGTARNDRPSDPERITAKFAMGWFCEIVTVVHGCRYEMNRLATAS